MSLYCSSVCCLITYSEPGDMSIVRISFSVKLFSDVLLLLIIILKLSTLGLMERIFSNTPNKDFIPPGFRYFISNFKVAAFFV